MTAKEKPVEIHLERLVEIVRAGRERCDFATPVVITKIEKEKEEKKEEDRFDFDTPDVITKIVKDEKHKIEEDRCGLATPVSITKIEKGKKKDNDGHVEDIERNTFNKTSNLTANETGEVNASSTNQTDITEPKIENTGAGKEYQGKPDMVAETAKVIEDLDLLLAIETDITEPKIDNDGASKDDQEKPNLAVETAKVIEDLDLLLAVEKCACTAADQVPVLVFDHFNREEEDEMLNMEEVVEIEEEKAHLNIFKIDLDKLEVIKVDKEEQPKVNTFIVDLDKVHKVGFDKVDQR